MTIDTFGRRRRTAPPQRRAERVIASDADYLIFDAIDRHGPLPSPYLYEFTKHLRRDFSHLQNRLTEFYNGDRGGPWLIRPPQQFASYHARYQHLVYDLAPRAIMALAERRTNTRTRRRRSDPFVHQLMQACVAASLELCCARRGLRYIPHGEILARAACPARDATDPMAIPVDTGRKALIPDDLFGLEYPGVGFRFFALEIDRHTESIERTSLGQSAFAAKVAGYAAILRNQSFRTHWGIPNLHVLTVTTNAAHALNIVEHVRKHVDPAYADRFVVACEPMFGVDWRVPRKLLSALISEAWRTPIGVRDIGSP